MASTLLASSPVSAGPSAYHRQTQVGCSAFRGRDMDKALVLCDLIAARIEVIAALLRLYRARGRE